jgi:hypothetical protein
VAPCCLRGKQGTSYGARAANFPGAPAAVNLSPGPSGHKAPPTDRGQAADGRGPNGASSL